MALGHCKWEKELLHKKKLYKQLRFELKTPLWVCHLCQLDSWQIVEPALARGSFPNFSTWECGMHSAVLDHSCSLSVELFSPYWNEKCHWPPPVKPMFCFVSRMTRVAVHQSYYYDYLSFPELLSSQLHSTGLFKFVQIYAILLPLGYDWWFLVWGDYSYTFISSHLLWKPSLNKWR